jgi:hypothetical protein
LTPSEIEVAREFRKVIPLFPWKCILHEYVAKCNYNGLDIEFCSEDAQEIYFSSEDTQKHVCSRVLYLLITGDLQLEFISEDQKSFICISYVYLKLCRVEKYSR